VAFLDIKMPGLSGMEAAREIAGRCHIVFVTAFDQYAIEAFEQEAVDYLLKPVSLERLQTTVQRLQQRMECDVPPSDHLAEMARRILSQMQETRPDAYLQWIRVQHKDEIRLIPVASVSYFKADEKYTLVMTADEEFLIRTSIKELTAQLDPDRFWQVHRATIVNVDRIAGISRSATGRGVLKLKDRGDLLTVSRPFLHLFKQM
jgi:DNA-binding LytR/AlgR family response regulator